jgi:hypothetical protein
MLNVEEPTLTAEEGYQPITHGIKQMPVLQIKQFKGTGDDLEAWIKHADIVVRANEWNETAKFHFMVTS